ncbi:MAG TPA: hypothetical protein VF210_17170 [Pseudomonadales bacterium]
MDARNDMDVNHDRLRRSEALLMLSGLLTLALVFVLAVAIL